MKKIILFLLISISTFGQNPVTPPARTTSVLSNQNYNNRNLYNATTINFASESLTTAQMNAITTPKLAREIYNVDTNTKWYYNGTIWVNMGNFWGLNGNSNTTASNFIGTTDANNLRFVTNNKLKSILPVSTDFISLIAGIEPQLNEYIANPTLINNTSSGIVTLNGYFNTYNIGDNGNYFPSIGYRLGGTLTSPSIPTVSNAYLHGLVGAYYNGTAFRNVARIFTRIVGVPTATSAPTQWSFQTTPVNSTTAVTQMLLNENGNLGINTTTPTAKLHVKGTFTTESSTAAANQVANFTISTAQVDVASVIVFNQTTAGISITSIGSPTSTTTGRFLRIHNIGTASFSYLGDAINPNTFLDLHWNGGTWAKETSNSSSLPSVNGGLLFGNGTTQVQDATNLFYDDTNNRLGIGTSTPLSTFDVNGSFAGGNIRTITGSITCQPTDRYIVCLNGAVGITVNLPTASTCPRRSYTISRGKGSTGTFSISGVSMQNYTGALVPNLSLGALGTATQKGTWTSDGTTWWLTN